MEISQVVAAVAPKLPPPTSPDYTWAQSWRFMAVGCIKALWWSSAPVGTYISMYYWEVPFPWRPALGIAASVWGPTAVKYWKDHWHLLKLPSIFDTPPEWGTMRVEAKITQTDADSAPQVTQIDKTVATPPKPTQEV